MSHITAGHVRAFQYVRTAMYDNIILVDCFINGEQGVAIVMIDHPDPQHIAVMPLFVAITPGMEIDFPGEEERDDAGGGGRSKNPRKAYQANKSRVTTPIPK